MKISQILPEKYYVSDLQPKLKSNNKPIFFPKPVKYSKSIQCFTRKKDRHYLHNHFKKN